MILRISKWVHFTQFKIAFQNGHMCTGMLLVAIKQSQVSYFIKLISSTYCKFGIITSGLLSHFSLISRPIHLFVFLAIYGYLSHRGNLDQLIKWKLTNCHPYYRLKYFKPCTKTNFCRVSTSSTKDYYPSPGSAPCGGTRACYEMEWKMVWNGRRILVWSIEDAQNGMEDGLPY